MNLEEEEEDTIVEKNASDDDLKNTNRLRSISPRGHPLCRSCSCSPNDETLSISMFQKFWIDCVSGETRIEFPVKSHVNLTHHMVSHTVNDDHDRYRAGQKDGRVFPSQFPNDVHFFLF